MIYLDNGATTQPLDAVKNCVLDFLNGVQANPSSPHSEGQTARRVLERARIDLACFLLADENRLVFTSGATEANHAVLLGAHLAGLDLITTVAEHPSTVGVFAKTPNRMLRLPIGPDGRLDPNDVKKAAFDHPNALFAFGWVNGETGTIQPAHEICDIARSLGIATLVDAAQAIGRIAMPDGLPDADFFSGSAHKMNALPGTGYLQINRNPFTPVLQFGGGQEGNRRSGTENTMGIIAFGTAAARRAATLEDDLIRIRAMRDRFEAEVLALVPELRINGSRSFRAPGATSLTFPGIDGAALVAACDAAGLILSQVSACSSARPVPSVTLTAMGLTEADAFSSVRVSFAVTNSEEEAKIAANIIIKEALRLQKISGAGL